MAHTDSLGNYITNSRDMSAKGRGPLGGAKIKESEVRAIRELAPVLSRVEIADMYDLDPRYVGEIVRGDTWKHIC